jgi:MoaA/NifB/PqqE/SkfB family radical SAM enzyme
MELNERTGIMETVIEKKYSYSGAGYHLALGIQQGACRGTQESVSGKSDDRDMRKRLDRDLKRFFIDALRVSLAHPRWWPATLRLLLNQRSAAKKRLLWQKQNVHVPPFLIVSVTSSCNLRCAGCYAQALHAGKEGQLSASRLGELFSEAKSLGVSTVMIAGGEPLTRKDLFEVTAAFPSVAFALFTNSTLVDDTVIRSLQKQRNIVPVLSIEGNRLETDDRRGEGIFQTLESTMARLDKKGIFFGCSMTVTRNNFGVVTDAAWIERLYRRGCRLFIFVEYIPVTNGSDTLAPAPEQRSALINIAAGLRKKFPALFVAFPGDEEKYGGCLAAGRGFIHISPSGDIEPCPFAPFADRNVAETSLKRALRSPLLEKIRENHGRLKETSGGCALWKEREWVASLLK